MVMSRALGLVVVPAAVVGLAGCASNVTHAMGVGSGYHYSSVTCPAPSSLPGEVVTVTLADMGMTHMMGGVAATGEQMSLTASPTTVAAGQVSLVASNRGWRTHELVIIPLASGAKDGQRIPGRDGKVDEAGSLGEASGACSSGMGKGIAPGEVGWTTITLKAGRYELICNLQNHYADGMHSELDVS
jgi:uncharacterized cupredoxin-like copper-binding protein